MGRIPQNQPVQIRQSVQEHVLARVLLHATVAEHGRHTSACEFQMKLPGEQRVVDCPKAY